MQSFRRTVAHVHAPHCPHSGRRGMFGSSFCRRCRASGYAAAAASPLRVLSLPGLRKIVVQLRIALRAVLGVVCMVAVVRLFGTVVALCAYDRKRDIQLPSSLSARAVRSKGAHRDVDGARPKQHRALHGHRPAGLLGLGHVGVGEDKPASGHDQYAGYDYHGP